jgi:hypothetical protein
VSAEEAKPKPESVRFTAEIEPLVRLIVETSRASLREVLGRRIRRGLSSREVVTALQLAGIRNMQSRTHAGGKFHGVLVVNAAHMASQASPPEHRWLPIFYALDYFKETQSAQAKAGAWTLAAVKESALPPAHKARQAFVEAMDHWDEAAADAAVTSLVRSAGAQEVAELFFHYGARAFHDWHHSIFVANSLRLLQSIGWQNAEPIVRSLTYALVRADTDADHAKVWQENQKRADQMRGDWLEGRVDSGATRDLLGALRHGSADDAGQKVAQLSQSGIAPQALWDALHVRSTELLMCQRGFGALHSVTEMNALRHAWRCSGSDKTRRLLLLQSASRLPYFLAFMGSDVRRGGKVTEFDVETLQPEPLTAKNGEEAGEILSDISGNRMRAARKILTYTSTHPLPKPFFDAARAMVFFKGDEPHDYKFSEAVFEDYPNISPEWRNRYLAAGVYWLRGAGEDSPLVARTRAALQG